MANAVKQLGFDPHMVLDKVSDLDNLKAESEGYQWSIARLKEQKEALTKECSSLQQMVYSYNQSISIYQELADMGFSLKELKFLWHTINEVAIANNIPLYESVQKFLRDIEEQYDDKLGF